MMSQGWIETAVRMMTDRQFCDLVRGLVRLRSRLTGQSVGEVIRLIEAVLETEVIDEVQKLQQ